MKNYFHRSRICNFIVQALRNQPITLYGDGTQTHSFYYIVDLIEGFVRLMNRNDAFAGPVNCGNPGEFSMKELAEKIKSLTGSYSKLIHEPLPTDDLSCASPISSWRKSNWVGNQR